MESVDKCQRRQIYVEYDGLLIKTVAGHISLLVPPPITSIVDSTAKETGSSLVRRRYRTSTREKVIFANQRSRQLLTILCQITTLKNKLEKVTLDCHRREESTYSSSFFTSLILSQIFPA